MKKITRETEEKIEQLLKELTIEEKASLLGGMDAWRTKPIERLGIPSIMVADGPHGLRKQREDDLFVLENSYKATCFPPASLLACSWDTELAHKQGEAISEEAHDQELGVVLGPGNNIKRSPLCGRNFEYFSEDPFLSSHMAKGVIDGLQDNGSGCSLKHFCANNQETNRWSIDTYMSERTLREIYLASFEYAVKNAEPATIMVSYNRLMGDYTTQSKWLLNDILRVEWGYKGLNMSDWGAIDNRPQSVYAGLDLEMPTSYGVNEKEIVKAYNGEKYGSFNVDKDFSGKLSMTEIDDCVRRVLTLVYTCVENKKTVKCDYDAHYELARHIASECMVLLKNEKILPLKKNIKVSVLGELATKPRYQGSGSSRVNSYKLSDIFSGISEYAQVEYADGYSLKDDNDVSGISKAADIAANSEVSIIVIGLPDSYESEGFDRKHMCIPQSHIDLVNEVYKKQKNIVVVLCNGAPIEMPFLDKASAVLEAYLGGEGGGQAVADILFGVTNPCGKLAETFPICLEQNPSYISFPGNGEKVSYDEGVFVGYRYYDSKKITPLFPFGFGLSYTEFEYSNMLLESVDDDKDNILKVTVDVANVGNYDGKEIVQLYVSEGAPKPSNPIKALKGFTKLFIKSGETQTATFVLDKRAFSIWDENKHNWTIENGRYTVYIGSSSADIRLSANIDFNHEETNPISVYSEFYELSCHKYGRKLAEKIAKMLGKEMVDCAPDEPGSLSSINWCLLKKLITLCNLDMTYEQLQAEVDKINEKIKENN